MVYKFLCVLNFSDSTKIVAAINSSFKVYKNLNECPTVGWLHSLTRSQLYFNIMAKLGR